MERPLTEAAEPARRTRAGPAARRHERRLYATNFPAVFALLALTRRLGDVVAVPGIGRVVNDATVARDILLAPDRFNSHERGSFGFAITGLLGPNALINMDGPAHQTLKRDLLQVFSSRYIREIIEATTGPMLGRLRAELIEGATVDFAAFMRQYGCAMACALIGVTVDPDRQVQTYEDIFWLATQIMAFAGPRRRELSARDRPRAEAYVERLAAYIRESYERDDGADHSVTRRLRAQGLDFETVKGLVSVVMVGATELVIYGLPRALAVLADSGALPTLRREPDRLDLAIDESLRLTTPSNVILRACGADCEIRGHRFARGERVLIAFRNIMRQDKHFPDPERFDLDRRVAPELRRLPFGAGVHTCLGTALTLAEMRQVLQMIVTLPGDLEIVRRRAHRGKLYPGYSSLAVRLSRA